LKLPHINLEVLPLMRKPLIAAMLVLATAAALTGCSASSGGSREVTVEMTNYKLTPTGGAIVVKPGAKVTFNLVNKSDTDHEFESDEGKFEEVVVPANKSRKVEWTAPAKAGEYEFECDMAGHNGMEVDVTVKE
jgi:plastocyanin